MTNQQQIDAAHRALRELFVHGKQARECMADIAAAGNAFLGVACAFFCNVMEFAFSGHESVEQVQTYLEDLKRTYPAELTHLQPELMAMFVLLEIGPGALPSGQPRIEMTDGLIYQMRLLAEYTAKKEGIVGEQLELYLFGAGGRYGLNPW
ncbi:hypothetical protein GCM10010193_62240 [Kitasatospora atroaurantiaca]|uniref:Uncharacterized protein n=1 Tax=Kitasatospora atroaurantiaca TaxID=285545 RepID=A0A561F1Z9_9ACTN|nr:hypothetical protein [Kitasatospora atroaurantiaca]TWE21852.1 hypothetical protein FB465_7087 [Kitasatospora atroaurantiaca]